MGLSFHHKCFVFLKMSESRKQNSIPFVRVSKYPSVAECWTIEKCQRKVSNFYVFFAVDSPLRLPWIHVLDSCQPTWQYPPPTIYQTRAGQQKDADIWTHPPVLWALLRGKQRKRESREKHREKRVRERP